MSDIWKCDKCETVHELPKHFSVTISPTGSFFDLCNNCLDKLWKWLHHE